MNEDRLIAVYDKTHGYCHICHKKLSLKNYGKNNEKGAWHIEHSIPKAKGGTDHLNNLFPACIPCNLEKGTLHNRVVRKRYGTTRAPYSKTKKDQIRSENTLSGGIVGFVAGLICGGTPLAIAACTAIGAKIGNDTSVKR